MENTTDGHFIVMGRPLHGWAGWRFAGYFTSMKMVAENLGVAEDHCQLVSGAAETQNRTWNTPTRNWVICEVQPNERLNLNGRLQEGANA